MATPITNLKGVGARNQELLKRLGIETVEDLVRHTPRRYDDYSRISSLNSLQPGPVSVRVKVSQSIGRYVRRGLHITEAILDDGTDSIKAVWFNQPYRKQQLRPGVEYFASGNYEFSNRRYALMNPSLEKVSDFPKNTARIIPIYKETKGLKSHTLRKLVAQINFDQLSLDDSKPYESDLTDRQAYQALHFPRSVTDIQKAHDHFAFTELFALLLSSALVRAQTEQFKARVIEIYKDKLSGFVSALPFKLTDDQRQAAWRILGDMQQARPMNRLLEGDVGSGKTVVAGLVAYNTVLAGGQVAIMVPTEVLARQHLDSFTDLLAAYDLSVELYVGSLKKSEKGAVKQRLAKGEVNVVIGTHALIQESVDFSSLELVVIDEQHRFGVDQRNRLVGKSKAMPHVLTMTATPIPRTLALTVFGDLDISLLTQMPAGRKPVKTKIVPLASIRTVYNLIHKEVGNGRQAFIIYPLVEESDTLAVGDAESAYAKLSAGTFKDYRVGLIHGRLKSQQKDEVMRQFADGSLDVLIATTVIEVGVNVPNATVMVVEGAERFGLAQIHQLRGRVGRSEHQSYCVLVPSLAQNTPKRLRALETLRDGFALAEYDLQERGPGAIYGSVQSGSLDLRYTKLDDPKMIAAAKQAVTDFMKSPNDLLKYPSLKDQVNRFKSVTHLN